MHVLFERVLHLEIRLMLKCFIYEERFVLLDVLNSRIESFAYGRTEYRTKPSKPITQSHITGSGKLPLSGLFMCMQVSIYIYIIIMIVHVGSLTRACKCHKTVYHV